MINKLTDDDGYAYRACWPHEYQHLSEGTTANLAMDSIVYPILIGQHRPGGQREAWLPMTNPDEVRTWLAGRKLIRVLLSDLSAQDYFVCPSPAQIFVRAEALSRHFKDA